MPRWILVAVLLAGLAASSQAQEKPQREILSQKPGEGEVCLVCKQQVHGADVVEVRYQGRRFHVKAAMLKDFDQDPERYFQELQARAGLFDEQAVGGGRASYGWLVFGIYVLVGLIFAAICGYLAIHRGHLPLPWFFAGLAGNVAALFVLLMTPPGSEHGAGVPAGLAKVPLTRSPETCPQCGATNHPSASACSACEAVLQPGFEPEMARV